MKAISLDDRQISLIEHGLLKMLVSDEEREWVGKDYVVVGVDDNSSPGTIYIYKQFQMDTDVFNSLRPLHFLEEEEKPGKMWGAVFRYRPFVDKLVLKEMAKQKPYSIFDVDVNLPAPEIDNIHDIENYDPRRLDNSQLANDWRIVSAWYFTKMSGKDVKHSREQIENLALIIVREMLKRGVEVGSDAKKETRELLKRVLARIKQKGMFSEYFSWDDMGFAVVERGGLSKGLPRIARKEFLSRLQGDFKTRRPYAYLVGGMATHEDTEGDIDILVKDKNVNPTFEFRIYRQLPKEWWPRVQFIYDVDGLGPFTNFIPLYDQTYQRQGDEMEEMEFSKELDQDFMAYPLRYIGSKNRLLHHVFSSIPKDCDILFDVFAGSGIVSWSAKKLGMKVVANDVLNCSYSILKAIVENNSYHLSNEEMAEILAVKGINGYSTQRFKTMYDEPTRQYIDAVVQAADKMAEDKKNFVKACIFTTMFRLSAMTRSFVIDAISWRKEWPRGGEFLPIFKQVLNEKMRALNSMVVDGEARVFNKDSLKLSQLSINHRMAVYLDPPYISEHSANSEYSNVYARMDAVLLQRDVKGTVPWSKKDFLQRLDGMFQQFKDAGAIILSYKISKEFPPSTIVSILRKYKPHITVKTIPLKYDIVKKDLLGKKDAMDSELLIIGTDSKKELRELSKEQVDNLVERKVDSSFDGEYAEGLKIGTFFTMLKAQAGYRKNELYNPEAVAEHLNSLPDGYPAEVDIKYDGMNVQAHKSTLTPDDTNVTLFSDDGGNVTNAFPSIIKNLRDMSQTNFILVGEIEGWKDGEHLGRAQVSGHAHEKKGDDSAFIFTIHDVLAKDAKPINTLTRVERLKALDEVFPKSMDHVKKFVFEVVENKEQLLKAIEKMRAVKGSEGAMIKTMSSTYPLTGNTNKWVKFKNEMDIDAEIVAIHQVKGSHGYNYICAIRTPSGAKIPVGVTYNTILKGKVGDIIRVAFTNLNRYTDKTGKVWFNWWAPRPIEMRDDKREPDGVDTANRLVVDSHGENAEKEIPMRFRELFENMELMADCSQFQDLGMWEEYPGVEKPKFVLQAHIRGRNVHLDNRRQVTKDFGVGMTLPLNYSLSRDATSFTDAVQLFNKELKDKVFSELNDPNQKLLAIKKETVPIEWFGVEGEVPEGEVGATKNLPAFFIILDEGDMEFLTLKPYFHEYQFHGRKGFLNGKFVDREIPGKEGTGTWLFFKTDSPPYVLTNRAVKENWMPPKGVSGLPRDIEQKIPAQFKYWLKDDEEERKQLRDQLFQEFKRRSKDFESYIMLPSTSDRQGTFSLYYQTWPRTKEVIRAGPVRERWLTRVKIGDQNIDIASEDDPTISHATSHLYKFPDEMKEEIKERSGDINPYPTPSQLQLQDDGTVEIGSLSPSMMKLELHGERVKGTFILYQEEGSDNVWVFGRSESPTTSMTYSEFSMTDFHISEFSDFSNQLPADVSTTNPDVLFIEGPLFREGRFGNAKRGEDIYYPREIVKNAKLEPKHRAMNLAYLNVFHEKFNELARVGVITDLWWNEDYQWTDKMTGTPGKGALWCRAVVTDKDGIKMILSKKQYQFSAEVKYHINELRKANWMSIMGAAILDTPAVDTAQVLHYYGRKAGQDSKFTISGSMPVAM